MTTTAQSLLAPIRQAHTRSQELAGLAYLWAEGVRAFRTYESGFLDRTLSPGEQALHQKFLNGLLETGRFFESHLEDIETLDFRAFDLSPTSLLTTARELEEWKETLSNGQV